jgi:membrane protein YqaA with SNARE-associated domain
MLLSWVPLIGDVLVLLAGTARMGVWRFIGWTILGKLSRYALVALAVERL